MDAKRTARIAELAATAGHVWAENHDGSALQEFLKEIGWSGSTRSW
ncbi:hypothetical protein AB0F11_22650 [Streptomyces sp. NPDC032472]